MVKTKAAVVNGVKKQYEMEELQLKEVGLKEARVRLVASGICQSDEGYRKGTSEYPFPAVFGHEGAGIVEEVGSGVTNFEVGDQVLLAYDYCGECEQCRLGTPSLCDNFVELNTSGGPDENGNYTFEKKMVRVYMHYTTIVHFQLILLLIKII